MPSVTDTYWTSEVYSLEGERERCLVMAPADTLPEAIAAMYQDATYYQSQCGYTVRATLRQHCGHCKGSGRVPGRAKLSWKPCPHCKGNPELVAIEVPVLSGQYVLAASRCADTVLAGD